MGSDSRDVPQDRALIVPKTSRLLPLPVVMLLLVLVPTGILTWTANQLLQRWRGIIVQNMDLAAAQAARSVAEQIDAVVRDEAGAVARQMAEALDAGGHWPRLSADAARLAESLPTASTVFLFLNPWGFVIPDERSAAAASRSQSEERALLRDGLLHEIGVQPGAVLVPLRLGEDPYVFMKVPAHDGFYAGCKLDPAAIVDQIDRSAATYRANGMRVWLSGLPNSQAETNAGILVADSLQTKAAGVPEPSPVPDSRRLASAALSPPLQTATVCASMEQPGRFERELALQARLYRWTIVLTCAGILAGAWLVMTSAISQLHAIRRREDFVIGLSHDLRTPLTSMKVLVDALHGGGVHDPGKRQVFLETIGRECDKLRQLAERVVFFVRYGQDGLTYRRRAVDVGALIRQAKDDFDSRYVVTSPRDAARIPTLATATDERLPCVWADETALRQVLWNLLDNAVKYSPDHPHITLRATFCQRVTRRCCVIGRRRTGVLFSVEDRGIGIDRMTGRHLFSRFTRGATASRHHLTGVGLGLAMCRDIVRAHGGRIWYESLGHGGTVFHVFWPAAKEEEQGNIK